MWYGQGTIQVAANGTTATGTGTQFLGNVRVGDGIAIQGSASLHEVTGVTSNTQLTFAPPFAGTAGSGKAFRVVPVLGYDKDLSDAFNALRLEFGDQLSNLQPWATAPTLDAAQTALGMSASGKTVATGTPAQGRTALGLGTAATVDLTNSPTDTTAGRALKVGDGGILSPSGWPDASSVLDAPAGLYAALNSSGGPAYTTSRASLLSIYDGSGAVYGAMIHFDRGGTGSMAYNVKNGAWLGWARVRDSRNTTVDANGFIKNASPIIKLHADRIESSSEESPAFQRLDTGHYQITGCNGLRLSDGWYIETPHDKNGNKYFNVEWEQDIEPDAEAGVLDEPADVALTIRCYERIWNPQTGQYDNGDPVDIPEGRWIDLRLNEVRQPEPEMPEDPEAPQQPTEPGAPIVPHVVTKAQGKTALIQTGLWQAVADYVAAIEDETERMLAEVALHDAQDYRRYSPFLNAAADALGITEEQKDDLFILASSIVL